MPPNQPTVRQAILPKSSVQLTGPFLAYLFVAEFKDGTTLAQTPEDKSELREDKSAFYDVLQRENDLARFHLSDGNNWYTVDLRDGVFEINGLPFYAHSQFTEIEPPLHLIYFRETHRLYGTVPDGVPAHYVNRYFIGWWFKDEAGNKVEQTIAIN